MRADMVPGATFPEWSTPLRPGDEVVALTDGATEAWNAEGEAFGDARLAAVVAEAVSQYRPVGRAVSAALDAFVGAGRLLADDVTLIAVRWAVETTGISRPTAPIITRD